MYHFNIKIQVPTNIYFVFRFFWIRVRTAREYTDNHKDCYMYLWFKYKQRATLDVCLAMLYITTGFATRTCGVGIGGQFLFQ